MLKQFQNLQKFCQNRAKWQPVLLRTQRWLLQNDIGNCIWIWIFREKFTFFFQIWKKNQQKFWKKFATVFFFAFGSPSSCQMLTKFHQNFQKRDQFFPKSCKVATHLAADTAAFAAQKTTEIANESVHFQNVCIFLMNLVKN